MPITMEPRYKGWPDHRYGPELVTSRPFCTWPAAQTRRLSPSNATSPPETSVHQFGRARRSTAAPKTNPSGTRSRARRPTRLRAGGTCGEATVDGINDFLNRDVQQTRASLAAPSLVVASAGIVPGDNLVVVLPRAVPGRVGRTVDADDGHAHGRGEVQRTRVAPDEEPRRPRQRHDPGKIGRRSGPSGAARCRRHLVGQGLLAGPPEHHRPQAVALTYRGGGGTVPPWRPPFVRPATPRVDDGKRSGGGGPQRLPYQIHGRGWCQVDREDAGGTPYSDCRERREVLVHHVHRPADVAGLGVEETRGLLPEVSAIEADDPLCARTTREHRRSHQALQVKGDIVRAPAQLTDRPQEALPPREVGFAARSGRSSGGRPGAGENGHAIDDRHEPQDNGIARVDEPPDPRRGEALAERGRGRQGMDDITE